MERNEISVMKGRGASGRQIFGLYFLQSCFMALVGAAGGIPLGGVFAEVLGSARSFLEFDLQAVNLPKKEAIYCMLRLPWESVF